MQWPCEKLMEKMWETIADKGIGSLLKPWQMRREGTVAAELKRLTILAEAQAEVDAHGIRSGKLRLLNNVNLVEASIEAPPVAVEVSPGPILLHEAVKIAAHNADVEAFRREISIAKAVLYAEAELAQDGRDPPVETIADDWLLRWRENAAAVSSDDLLSLWGKVLASEVKEPGQFSLRVLDFLRNLSRTEAKELELLSRVTIGEYIFIIRDKEFAALGITFGVFRTAEELGILATRGAFEVSLPIPSESPDTYQSVIKSYNRAICIRGSDPAKMVNIPCYVLTRLGQQVLQLAGRNVDENYLLAVGAVIEKQGFEVVIKDFAPTDIVTVQAV